MKTTKIKVSDRVADRIRIILIDKILQQPAENIIVNAPVALSQCALLNELNGILLGIELASLRTNKLPITKDQRSAILKAIK